MFVNHSRRLLLLLFAAFPIALPAVAASAEPAAIKIAIYDGPGHWGNGPPDLMKEFASLAPAVSVAQVSPNQIQKEVLSNFNVVIFAGGSGSREAEALGETGRAEVQKFVGGGGGYIGICAGAYLATSGYPWSLHIINARTLSSKWRRGIASLKIELTQAGRDVFGGAKTNLEILYHNGPVVGPACATNLPAYVPLAFFRDEVASNDTPQGIMVNSPAIFAGQYGRGKVICISPHPEQTAGLEYIVRDAVKWVAR